MNRRYFFDENIHPLGRLHLSRARSEPKDLISLKSNATKCEQTMVCACNGIIDLSDENFFPSKAF